MELSIKTLMELLAGFRPELKIQRCESIKAEQIFICRPNPHIYSGDTLYIAKMSWLKRFGRKMDPPKYLICIIDCEESQEYIRIKEELLFLMEIPGMLIGQKDGTKKEVWYTDIFQALRGCEIEKKWLTSRESIKDDMIDALHQGKGLEEIIFLGSEYLGNPLLLTAIGMDVLSFSMEDDMITDIFRSVEIGRYRKRVIRKNTGIPERIDSMLDSTVPSFHPEESRGGSGPKEGMQIPRAGLSECAVRVRGIPVAYLTAAGAFRPLLPEDMEKVAFISKIVSIELQRNGDLIHNEGKDYEGFLIDLLKGRITDHLVIREHTDLLKKRLKEQFQIITVRCVGEMDHLSVLQKAVRPFFNEPMSVVCNGDIVLLASCGKDQSMIPDEKGWNSYLKRNNLMAGFSCLFEDLVQIPNFYDQSQKALQLGILMEPEKQIYNYSRYYIFDIIRLCSEKMQLMHICHPLIVRLSESSDPGDRELLRTLYAYLNYQKDTKKTAEALNIHRNTLYYRIDRLRDLLGDELEKSDSLLRLLFSFKLMEYSAKAYSDGITFWELQSPDSDV